MPKETEAGLPVVPVVSVMPAPAVWTVTPYCSRRVRALATTHDAKSETKDVEVLEASSDREIFVLLRGWQKQVAESQ